MQPHFTQGEAHLRHIKILRDIINHHRTRFRSQHVLKFEEFRDIKSDTEKQNGPYVINQPLARIRVGRNMIINRSINGVPALNSQSHGRVDGTNQTDVL